MRLPTNTPSNTFRFQPGQKRLNSILFTIVLIAFVSLQCSAQNNFYLADKTNCGFSIEYSFCNGGGGSASVNPMDILNISIGSNVIMYYKIFFPGSTSADITVFPNTCEPQSVSGTNPCETGNVYINCDSSINKFSFSAW